MATPLDVVDALRLVDPFGGMILVGNATKVRDERLRGRKRGGILMSFDVFRQTIMSDDGKMQGNYRCRVESPSLKPGLIRLLKAFVYDVDHTGCCASCHNSFLIFP